MDTLTLTLLAAGLSSRYGAAKTVEPVGPDGESLLDYAIYDALASGFGRVVFVVRKVGEDALLSRYRARFGRAAPVDFVRQELWHLPAGLRPSSERMRPWGTGHAVLRLAEAVRGPFAVANADDFYGRSSFAKVAEFLRERGEGPQFCLVGFPLETTLSAHGGVSRAVCDVDAEGRLVGLEEVLDVHRSEEGVIVGRTARGAIRTLAPDTPVSMNLWGLTPAAFPLLEARFAAFLEKHGEDAKREFLLSDAVGDLIRARQATVQLLRSEEPWFGMTFREDRERVERRIADLVESGQYPPSIRKAVRVTDPRVPDEAAPDEPADAPTTSDSADAPDEA
jgi:hypothetical protein